MLYDLADIENAIIDAARADMNYCKTIDTYGGELDDILKGIKLVNSPAFLTAFDGGGFSGEEYPAYFYDQEVRFSVILISKSLRGDKARRHGSGAEAGTYTMITDTLTLISGKKFGLPELKPFEPVNITSLLQGKGISAYEIIFKTSMDYQTIGEG